MKKKRQNRIATTTGAAASMLEIPLFIVRAARDSGCSAFKANGRIDIVDLAVFIDYGWKDMPDIVFDYFYEIWKQEVRPHLPEKIGIAATWEEASERTGLSLSMLNHMRDAGSEAFLG